MTDLPLSREQIAAIQARAEKATFIATIRTDIPALCQQALRAIELEEAWDRDTDVAAKVICDLQSELTATRKALEEERERCAKIAERWAGDVDDDGCLISAPEGIAERIRALPAPEVKP